MSSLSLSRRVDGDDCSCQGHIYSKMYLGRYRASHIHYIIIASVTLSFRLPNRMVFCIFHSLMSLCPWDLCSSGKLHFRIRLATLYIMPTIDSMGSPHRYSPHPLIFECLTLCDVSFMLPEAAIAWQCNKKASWIYASGSKEERDTSTSAQSLLPMLQIKLFVCKSHQFLCLIISYTASVIAREH